MPRNTDKHNDRPRRPAGPPARGKGGAKAGGAGRGGPRSFGKGEGSGGDERQSRGAGKPSFGGKSFGGKSFGGKSFGSRPRGAEGERPRFGDKPFGKKKFGEKEFGERNFADRKLGDRKFGDRKFDDRPRREDGERGGFRKFDRPRDDRPQREGAERGGFRKFDRPRDDRPQREGAERGGFRKFDRPRDDRPQREGAERGGFRKFDRPRDDRPRREDGERGGFRKFDRPRDDRPQREGAERGGFRKFDRPRDDRPQREGAERGGFRKFDRPHGDRPHGDRPRRDDGERGGFRKNFDRHSDRDRGGWDEHPRSEARGRDRNDRGDFGKRAGFAPRDNKFRDREFQDRKPYGAKSESERRAPPPRNENKVGERIAKIIARAGACSRREAEEWITQGRVAVNGRVINSPALDVTERDVVTIDGAPLPERERTRLFLYHKPRGLMTTHADPEGRPTVFDNLPEGLPRLISIGRLDFNTEGLLLLTNDGGLARVLELPQTAWLRRYRVRAHGEVTQAQLDKLRDGIEVDGVQYGAIEATLEREQGSNVWITFAIREGKNREVRNVLAHLGLEVNRLIRISYGPFQLAELEEGKVEEIRARVLREQLGERVTAQAGAYFGTPVVDPSQIGVKAKPPRPKRETVADRKGRKVVVERSGDPDREDNERPGSAPYRRPKRGYHGKRDFTPRD